MYLSCICWFLCQGGCSVHNLTPSLKSSHHSLNNLNTKPHSSSQLSKIHYNKKAYHLCWADPCDIANMTDLPEFMTLAALAVSQWEYTSSKNTAATLRYSGLLKPKSTENVSQVLLGDGPTLKSHVLSRWSNNVLSNTLDTTCSPGFR